MTLFLDPGYVFESRSNQGRNVNVYTIWIPLVGKCTIWVKGCFEKSMRCEVVRVQKGLPWQDSWRTDDSIDRPHFD